MGLIVTISKNETQHNSIACHYADCHYAQCRVFYFFAECRYVECRQAKCHGTNSITATYSFSKVLGTLMTTRLFSNNEH